MKITERTLRFPKKVGLKIQTRLPTKTDIREVRILPQGVGYTVEIVYRKEINVNPLRKESNTNIIAIDLGIHNFITSVSNNGLKPFVVKGGVVKSMNQYYNKERAKLQAIYAHQGIKTGKKLQKLTLKRNRKITDHFHKISQKIIQYCVFHDINTIVIGYNPKWKQKSRLGKRNNQNFVSIPFYKLIHQLEYKADVYGINVIKQEECHTSKCSFLDHESVKQHKKYLGKRIHRGLFKSHQGILINTDVNGAYNIMNKAILNAVSADRIEAVGLHPIRWKLTLATS